MRFRRRKRPKIVKAELALKEAQDNLKRTRERTPEVQEVARALRVLREKNHFVERLEVIMIGGHR